MTASFLREARAAYVDANARTMRWIVERRRSAPFLDTKLNPLTLADYTEADGWRGPDYVYGWIQGRGLEALVRHAAFLAANDPTLAADLMTAARPLETALTALVRRDGCASFTYRHDGLQPVRPDADGRAIALRRDANISTFSDIFVAKGLLAARKALGRADAAEAAEWLTRIAVEIASGRFQIDEKADISAAALAKQHEEYGPRMIMLGAAALLATCGFSGQAGFAPAFIRHVMSRHLAGAASLLLDTPGQDRVNPGHAIEFVGFALEYADALGTSADIGATTDRLADILIASYRVGVRGPGLALYISAETGKPLVPWFPWWSLPEAIRAAALAYERTRRADMLEIWRDAHNAFFGNYWRGEPPVAYQTLTEQGPVDHVPATPDLDPGYHTGLSLLSAIGAIDRLS
jgi:hypothetical protein